MFLFSIIIFLTTFLLIFSIPFIASYNFTRNPISKYVPCIISLVLIILFTLKYILEKSILSETIYVIFILLFTIEFIIFLFIALYFKYIKGC